MEGLSLAMVSVGFRRISQDEEDSRPLKMTFLLEVSSPTALSMLPPGLLWRKRSSVILRPRPRPGGLAPRGSRSLRGSQTPLHTFRGPGLISGTCSVGQRDSKLWALATGAGGRAVRAHFPAGFPPLRSNSGVFRHTSEALSRRTRTHVWESGST